jgi:hypothetical protein
MKKFAMIQAQFRQLNCGHCEAAFDPQGVKLVREEADFFVVRVTCLACNHPAGVAVVGADYEPIERRAERAPAPKKAESPFANAAEAERFAALPAINTNDVLDWHGFLATLGADWARQLPGAR